MYIKRKERVPEYMRKIPTHEGMYLLDINQPGNRFWWFIITSRIVWLYVDDGSFKFLPYQLSMVRYWLTMVVTGNGELGFDSGEGAWEKEKRKKINIFLFKHMAPLSEFPIDYLKQLKAAKGIISERLQETLVSYDL